MGEAKFTKGEWVSHDKRPYCNGFSIFAGSQYVAFVGDSDNVTECETNAHLIAAAPEMYEMLSSLRDGIENVIESEGWYFEDATLDSIDSLLAKARGELHG